MTRRILLISLSLLLLLLLLATGCSRPGPAFLGRSGTVEIDGTEAHFATGDGRVFLLVWHDFKLRDVAKGSHTSGSTGSSAQRTTVEGTYSVFADQPRLTWKCTTVDGRSGEVVINGVAYELAAGNVFLVHDGQDGAEVAQLALEIPAAAAGADAFRGLARAHPAVELFLAGAR